MNYKLLLLLTLLGPLLAAAQISPKRTYVISGRVVSALTGDCIPYCQVAYDANKGTTSDSLGYFELKDLPTGQHKLSFRAIGYSGRDTTVSLTDSNITGSNWPVKTLCADLNQDSALTDIRTNQMKLFLQSGDRPIHYTSQKRFSKKYRVTFYDFGDLVHYGYDCLVEYNRAIFKYLDQKYGSKWRTSIRPNVPGYKK